MSSLGDILKGWRGVRFYGVFAFWWLALNWEPFQVKFFGSEELIFQKYGKLKNEYLATYFYGYDLMFWSWFALKAAAAFLLTLFVLWYLPRKFLPWMYRQQREYKFKKQEIDLAIEGRLQKKMASLQNLKVETLVATNEKVKVEKRVDKEVLWAEEYEELKQSGIYNLFDDFIESLYVRSGKVEVSNYQGETVFELDRDVLAYVDSNGLVNYDRAKGVITLTDKGKYFIRHYQGKKK